MALPVRSYSGRVLYERPGYPHVDYYRKSLGRAIKIHGQSLPEVALVTMLAPEGDETFELTPDETTKLLTTIVEAEPETASAPDIL